jgi:hypothetical protein
MPIEIEEAIKTKTEKHNENLKKHSEEINNNNEKIKELNDYPLENKEEHDTEMKRLLQNREELKEDKPELLIRYPLKQQPPIDLKTIYAQLTTTLPKIEGFENEIEYKLYILWCMSTWKYNSFDSTGYLAFYPENGGRKYDVGKSTALDIIEYLAYRCVTVPKKEKTDNRQQNLEYKVKNCVENNTTLCIDESQDTINISKGEGNHVYQWLKTSYRGRDYRFKCIAGREELPDDLLSRCIIIRMVNHYLDKLEKHQDILKEARKQLWIFNTFYYELTPYNERIADTNRTDEIFRNIITMACFLKIPYDDIIEYAKNREKQFSYVNEKDIIIKTIKNHAGDTITLKELFFKLNNREATTSELQSLGKKLRGYNIPIKRMNYGVIIKKSVVK